MPTARQATLGLALLSAALFSAGCHRSTRQAPEPIGGPVTLHIRNNAFFDVNVYALPTVGTDTRVRLATAPGHSTTSATVRPTALRAGGILVVYLHPIGTRYSWTSLPVQVASDMATCLDIQANSDGNLSRSSLYTYPGAVSTDAASSAAATVPVVRASSASDCGM